METCSPRVLRNLDSQGFARLADDRQTVLLARAARFQPRATLVLLAIGVVLHATGLASASAVAAWFSFLAVLAWLGVVVTELNVFDRFWDLVVARRTGSLGVGRTPAPRRFSQAIAATFLTTIAALFGAQAITAAYVVAAMMALAASLAAFAELCIGSALYHLVVDRSRAPT